MFLKHTTRLLRSTTSLQISLIATRNLCRRQNIFLPPLQRIFSSHTAVRQFSDAVKKPEELVTLHFRLSDGVVKTTKAKVGKNLLDIVLDNNIDIDGFGACEGTLACSTCHVTFKDGDFKKLPSSPCDEELDMLDLAYSLTPTSRLGCQVIVSKEMDGWEIEVPPSVDAR